MVWVAVIMACTSPLAVKCEIVVKPTSFSHSEPCMEEVNLLLKYLYDNEVMATGRCVQVAVGDPV